jgi:hypothetical protein
MTPEERDGVTQIHWICEDFREFEPQPIQAKNAAGERLNTKSGAPRFPK